MGYPVVFVVVSTFVRIEAANPLQGYLAVQILDKVLRVGHGMSLSR